MSDEDQKNYAQIVELITAIKKKLCTTWRSEQLDKQAISDLKFAISNKKEILDSEGKSVFDKLVQDFENWIYEIDTTEPSITHTDSIPVIASSQSAEVSTQMTL
jgi:hypothetical protein